MAYGKAEDYEWEEVEEDDWDVLCVDEPDGQRDGTQAGPRGIEFTIEDEGPGGKRRRGRAITKAERERAAAVHRSHVLCLAARALALDGAACSPEVQATTLSLLPASAALRNVGCPEGAQRAINGLLPLAGWFRGAFAVLPPDVVAGRGREPLDLQLLRSARTQSGTVEWLVALFVALVRAQGAAARVVRLLDAVPLHPWRARPAVVRTSGKAPLDLEAGDVLPGEAAMAMMGSGGSGGSRGRGRGRGRGSSKAAQLAAAVGLPGAGGRGGGRGRGGRKRGAVDAGEGEELETAAGTGTGMGTQRAASSRTELGGAGGEGGRKRKKAGEAAANGGGEQAAAQEPQQAAPRAASNRGEDEFERQLQLAMLTSQMEAAAAAAKAAAAGATGGKAAGGGKGGAAGGGAGEGSTTAKGRQKGAATTPSVRTSAGGGTSTATGPDAKAASGGSSGLAGAAMSTRPEVVVSCWAEVYCGCAARGRWVHVDVVNGYVDRPELVDSATHRPGGPVCYVVAAEGGQLRDVTNRYMANALAAQRNRDESWWADTVAKLEGRGQQQKQQQDGQAAAKPGAAVTGPAVSSGAGGSAAAGEPPGAGDDADDDVVEVPGPGAAPGSGSAAGGSTNGADRDPQGQQQQQQQRRKGVARIIDARLSHQRGEIQHPQGPRAGAGNGGSAGPSAPPAAPPAAPGAGPATTAAAAATPAALRAAREDAELAHRQLSQLQGLPTSIEGFKAHPLYVLKRHIGKYEALRPGTAPLGLHRGEPYYPRQHLSVLHTVERWRREGRQVRDGELASPAKVVKKRAVGPQGGVGAGGGGGGARRSASAPAGGRGGGRGKKGAAGGQQQDGEEEDEELMALEGGAAAPGADGSPTINLYGRWQTDEWHPPVAVGGVVPKNERGNVECPPLVPRLPIGTVHINLGPGLGGLCRQLEIDYAPGLVGFGVQGGRMVPQIEGVVVCEEVAELVTMAYLEREEARNAAAAAKRLRAGAVAWMSLLQALRIRLQLERDYAGEEEGDGGRRGEEGAGRKEAAAKGGAAAAAAVAAAAAGKRGGGRGPDPGMDGSAAAAVPSAAAQRILERLRAEAEGAEGAAGQQGGGGSGKAGKDTAADVEVEEF